MKELLEKHNELKSIILRSKKFNVRDDFHLYNLLEEISKQITNLSPTVYYLSSDSIGDIASGISDGSFDEEVKAHPKTLIYSLSDFQEAFNLEEISDLGYIVICNKGE